MLGELTLSGRAGPRFGTARWPRARLVACCLVLVPATAGGSPSLPSLTAPIREEIGEVEDELASLPVFPINTSPWSLGYSSEQHSDPELPVVIDVTFPEPETIDLVALMPSSITDQRNEVQSWGFPVRFMIERVFPDGGTDVLADFRDRDYPTPGLDPQFFTCPDTVPTAGLRITVTEPAPNATWWRASQVVSFSELYAFACRRNAALNATVKASSSNEFGFMWSTRFLTDGFSLFSPLFHDLEDPENNIIGYGLEELQLDLDLGEVRRIDEFHLWPVVHDIQHNYPPASGIGFPSRIRIQTSLTPDFAEAEVIYNGRDFKGLDLIYRPGAGPFMHRTKAAEGRYVRFNLAGGFPDFISRPPARKARIAVSEIEVFDKGEILSRDARVRAWNVSDIDQRGAGNLTDGRSNEGQILPLREWLEKFKRRMELEALLVTLRADLDAAQLREERRFRTLLLMAIGLIVVLLQLIWLVRVAARRRAGRMRERIACDLHDEIGANVSSMAHTAELIAESIREPSPAQSRLLGNLVESARFTSRETKHFIRFIEGENHDHDIAEQFTRVADQILGTIPVSFSLENTRSFNALDPVTKWNLLLFYKETLNNIIKHAGAKAVAISTQRQGTRLELEVADDGRGMPEGTPSCRHLEERAAMLRGRLEIDSRLDEGTRIWLQFRQNSKT
jgi:signal transduction histidine kinase